MMTPATNPLRQTDKQPHRAQTSSEGSSDKGLELMPNSTGAVASVNTPEGFLRAVFGENYPGYIVLWTKQNKRSSCFIASDLDDAGSAAKNLATSKDVYFGIGLQERRLPANERGTTKTVIAIPGFWVDIDTQQGVHGQKNLPRDLEEARTLLETFPMAPTAIVETGGGLHAYWLFKEPWTFENDEERGRAAQLSKSLQREIQLKAGEHGWHIDQTADLARLLRLPGTYNHKGNSPANVKLIEFYEDRRYNPRDFDWLPQLPEGIAQPFVKKTSLAPRSDQIPLADAEPILQGCSWFRHCRDDAAHLSEPEWYASLSILGRCRGGKELAHAWSKPYPGYSRQETDEKLRHALGSAGPRTCEDIRSNGGNGYCRTCPNRGQIKSPIVLGTTFGGDSHQLPSIQWPDPLAPEAFYGLAGEIVKTLEPHTESDPAALLLQILVAFGVTTGHEPYFRVEADRHTCNIYAVIVGNTSKSRKGTSFGHVKSLFDEAEADWHKKLATSGLSSGEGLIWEVRDPIVKKELVKEKGRAPHYIDVISDDGVADKRLLVYEAEFASTLRVLEREGNTLSPILRQAWDNGDLRTMTKNSPARATGAHIGIIGHITPDELRLYLTRTEAGNGFANRFLYICATRSKLLPEGGNLDPATLIPIKKRLQEAIKFGRNGGEMYRSEPARALWREVYEELSRGEPGLFGAVTSRGEAQVLRLSCIYALLDCSLEIREEHLLAALAVWKYCRDSAKFIFGDSLGNPVADEILRALRGCPQGMTRTELRDLFKRNRRADEIGAALSLLAERGLARAWLEQTEGRKAERWIAL